MPYEDLKDPHSISEGFGGVGGSDIGKFQQQTAKRRDLRADARSAGKVTDGDMQRSNFLDDRAVHQLMSCASRKRCAQSAKEAVVNRRDNCLCNTCAVRKPKTREH